MTRLLEPRPFLSLVLWLVALHSALVGLGLIVHPAWLIARAGFHPLAEPFFPTQGGVFHIVMAVGYALAARDPIRRPELVRFAIVVKVMATVFLVTWWSLARPIPTVLLSGVADGAMAVVIAGAQARWRRAEAAAPAA